MCLINHRTLLVQVLIAQRLNLLETLHNGNADHCEAPNLPCMQVTIGTVGVKPNLHETNTIVPRRQ